MTLPFSIYRNQNAAGSLFPLEPLIVHILRSLLLRSNDNVLITNFWSGAYWVPHVSYLIVSNLQRYSGLTLCITWPLATVDPMGSRDWGGWEKLEIERNIRFHHENIRSIVALMAALLIQLHVNLFLSSTLYLHYRWTSLQVILEKSIFVCM